MPKESTLKANNCFLRRMPIHYQVQLWSSCRTPVPELEPVFLTMLVGYDAGPEPREGVALLLISS